MSCGAKQYLDVERLANAVLMKRRADRLSLRRAQQITGISASTLSRIECKKGVPDFDVVMTIREWLCVPLSNLLIGDADCEGVKPGNSPASAVLIKLARELTDLAEKHL